MPLTPGVVRKAMAPAPVVQGSSSSGLVSGGPPLKEWVYDVDAIDFPDVLHTF